jgi:mRNA interferase MazF
MVYSPQQGDIIFLNFNPQMGHEESGRRPALVVSTASFHQYTNLAIVCPITSTLHHFPLHVPLDHRTETDGAVMCEQVKSLDLAARNMIFKEKIPADLLEEVLDRIALFFQR